MIFKYKIYFFLSLFLFCLPQIVFSQFNFSPDLENIYNDLLKLKVKPAQSDLKDILKNNPKNGIAIYLDNYADVINLLVTEDKEVYDQIIKNEYNRIKEIKQLDKNSPYYLFTQAEIKLQWAVVKLKFGDEMNAFFDLQRAYKLLEENKRKFPGFLPQKKTLGLLHILIGSVPDKYHWIVNLFGMKGSIKQGLEEMNEVRNKKNTFRLETEIVYQLMNGYVIKTDSSTLESLQKIYSNNNDNLLICFLLANVAHKQGESELALPILHNCPKGADYISFNFLEYLKGDIYLRKGNYNNSIFFFEKFIKNTKGKNFLKDSYYKLLLAKWLTGNNFKSLQPYIIKIKKSGKEITEVDKYAQHFAEMNLEPNKILMKERLYFDGGYYDKAFEEFKNIIENSFINNKEKAEYCYRNARLLHKTNNITGAMNYYLKAIKLSENEQYYFGASAALQLGYIYQKLKEKVKAKIYFNIALSFKNHEYKNSIDSKAKAAFEELNK